MEENKGEMSEVFWLVLEMSEVFQHYYAIFFWQ